MSSGKSSEVRLSPPDRQPGFPNTPTGSFPTRSPPIYGSPSNGGGLSKLMDISLAGSKPQDEITYSFPKNKIKILLLENVSQTAVKLFQSQGFLVRVIKNMNKEKWAEGERGHVENVACTTDSSVPLKSRTGGNLSQSTDSRGTL